MKNKTNWFFILFKFLVKNHAKQFIYWPNSTNLCRTKMISFIPCFQPIWRTQICSKTYHDFNSLYIIQNHLRLFRVNLQFLIFFKLTFTVDTQIQYEHNQIAQVLNHIKS